MIGEGLIFDVQHIPEVTCFGGLLGVCFSM